MARRSDARKIDLGGSVGGGLQNPFAALDAGGLPSGPDLPEEVPTGEIEQKVKGRVILRRETARRAGKTVVVVSGFDEDLGRDVLEAWASELKRACGCGGTVEGREIVVQGDQPERVASFFRQKGLRVAGLGAR